MITFDRLCIVYPWFVLNLHFLFTYTFYSPYICADSFWWLSFDRLWIVYPPLCTTAIAFSFDFCICTNKYQLWVKVFFSFYSSLHHQPSLCICILRRDIFRWGSSRQLFMPNDVAILRGEDLGGSEPCGNSVYTYSLHYLYLFWKGKQTWQKYMLQQN